MGPKMKFSKKLKIDSRMLLERSNDIISEKYEVRSSNCRSFARGNLVGGLPLGRSTESLGYPHGGTPATFRKILRRKSKVICQKSTLEA